jgi:type III pantothenate kinase
LLLALDVGNTQTVAGLYDGARLVEHWRTTSVRSQTADELAVELAGLLSIRRRSFADVTATMTRTHFGHEALVVGPGVRTGLPLLVDNPHEVGADRVANCVAALERHPGPLVVVDFGTAINFDAVSAAGEFVGGAIAPGLEVSVNALGERAARLFRIELAPPRAAVGKNTAENMQSGAIFGFAGLVDGMVRRFAAELGELHAVATGGLAGVVTPHCETVHDVEPWLTLDGLRLIWERNR